MSKKQKKNKEAEDTDDFGKMLLGMQSSSSSSKEAQPVPFMVKLPSEKSLQLLNDHVVPKDQRVLNYGDGCFWYVG